MKPEQIKALQKFVCDPEFEQLVTLIEARFNLNYDVRTIKTEAKSDNAIIGEVIALQRLGSVLERIKLDFEQIKAYDPEKKTKKNLK